MHARRCTEDTRKGTWNMGCACPTDKSANQSVWLSSIYHSTCLLLNLARLFLSRIALDLCFIDEKVYLYVLEV